MSEPSFQSLDGETLLKTVLEYCVQKGASDIHFSPEKNVVLIQWRLHGVLQPLTTITHQQFADVIRRVKFEAKMKLNITSAPQDGQYTFVVGDRTVNVRIASLPSRFGEALTIRILDPKKGILPLTSLGFPESMRNELEALMQLPNGLILVTGPTGSGKTTTLYSLLASLTGKQRNIITLEDPVEYELPGIVQSEVDPDHGYTFAQGLRSVLRHDPNVILVGEIRDLDTAQTAVNAALTGHLVLSTLHTNSAIESVPRLLSMGVSAYTLAPALRAVLAQRLVRTLTPACRQSGQCDAGDNASYDGQQALPELLIASPAIRQKILANESTAALEEQARTEGFICMKEWGEKLVNSSVTTKEEIARVTA